MKSTLILILTTVLISLAVGVIAEVLPITGTALDSLMEVQNRDLQIQLEQVYKDEDGFLVTGPLAPFNKIENYNGMMALEAVRVLAPDIKTFNTAVRKTGKYNISFAQPWISGHLYEFESDKRIDTVLVMTHNMNRYLIWLDRVYDIGWRLSASPKLVHYTRSVSAYLTSRDHGRFNSEVESTERFALPETVALFAPLPDRVINNPEEIESLIQQSKEINIPEIKINDTMIVIDSAISKWFIDNAPKDAYPSKVPGLIQYRYREYLERGGKYDDIMVLTGELFNNLADGEYYFAVNLSGKVRIARKISDTEAEDYHEATGLEIHRPDHSLLFPGEPVLAAGHFFIDASAEKKLTYIDADSEFYFYNDRSETIRKDITERSDMYFKSLGHLCKALEDLGIDYLGARISKF